MLRQPLPSRGLSLGSRLVTALSMLVATLVVLVTLVQHAHAQTKLPTVVAAKPEEKPTDPVEEEVAPDSPRASMARFVAATNDARWTEAATYLELPKGEQARGPELAKMLSVVLGRKLWIDPETLSPLAAGKKDDGLPNGVDELGKLRSTDGRVDPVRIVRREAKTPDEEARWVFSAQTVSHVDTWYDALGERWVRAHLPAFLLREGPRTFLYWHLIALVVLGFVAYLGGRPFAWGVRKLVGRAAVRLRLTWDADAERHMRGPTRLACAVPVFFVGSRFLGLYQPANAFVIQILRALLLVAAFWFALRVVASLGGSVLASDWGKDRPSLRSFSSFTLRVGRFVVWVLGTVTVASELGFPVGSVITGLGIGGIAIALAAQKTVENLFGSVSILVDQPFRVGDTIRVDGVEGAVETVGLRSTRLRTADRSLVVLPNGKLADMRIESMSARDRTRFSTKLRVGSRAAPEQLAALVALLGQELGSHLKVRREDVLVRLSSITDGAFEIDVACAVETTRFSEFADVRQELLFTCIATTRKVGVELVQRDPAAGQTAPA